MTDSPIVRLDRYVLVVTPLQPWVDWVRGIEEADGLEEGEPPMTLEEAQLNFQTTFLVPYVEDAEDVVDWVRDNVDLIFEQMLHEIDADQGRWPGDRGPDAFDAWFDLDLLDAPIDLVDAPIYMESGGHED